MDYVAEIVTPDGTVHRVFETNDLEKAQTATRNYPAGWRVRVFPKEHLRC